MAGGGTTEAKAWRPEGDSGQWRLWAGISRRLQSRLDTEDNPYCTGGQAGDGEKPSSAIGMVGPDNGRPFIVRQRHWPWWSRQEGSTSGSYTGKGNVECGWSEPQPSSLPTHPSLSYCSTAVYFSGKSPWLQEQPPPVHTSSQGVTCSEPGTWGGRKGENNTWLQGKGEPYRRGNQRLWNESHQAPLGRAEGVEGSGPLPPFVRALKTHSSSEALYRISYTFIASELLSVQPAFLTSLQVKVPALPINLHAALPLSLFPGNLT